MTTIDDGGRVLKPALGLREKLILAAAIPLALLLALLLRPYQENQKQLDLRIETISAEAKRLAPSLRNERRYPLPNLRQGDASLIYRAISSRYRQSETVQQSNAISLSDSSLQKSLSELQALPPQAFEEFNNLLSTWRANPVPIDSQSSGRLQVAFKNAQTDGLKLLSLLQFALNCDHIHAGPDDFPRDMELDSPLRDISSGLAELILALTSQQSPADACETALLVYFFGHDQGYYPSLRSLQVSSSIKKKALASIEQLIKSFKLNETQLRRIISALGQRPALHQDHCQFEFLKSDCAIRNYFRPEPSPHANPGDSSPTTLRYQPKRALEIWNKVDQQRRIIQEIWAKPLSAKQSNAWRELESNPYELPDGIFKQQPSYFFLDSRLDALACDSYTQLVRLQAAALLFYRENKRWPAKPLELSDYFDQKRPTDPLTEGKDFQFELSESAWKASASPHRNPIVVSIPITTNGTSKK